MAGASICILYLADSPFLLRASFFTLASLCRTGKGGGRGRERERAGESGKDATERSLQARSTDARFVTSLLFALFPGSAGERRLGLCGRLTSKRFSGPGAKCQQARTAQIRYVPPSNCNILRTAPFARSYLCRLLFNSLIFLLLCLFCVTDKAWCGACQLVDTSCFRVRFSFFIQRRGQFSHMTDTMEIDIHNSI